MSLMITLFFTAFVVLTIIGWLADKRAEQGDKTVTPGLTLLPGDIKWESQNGRTKVYFPVVTSLVLSVVLSLVLRLFQ